MMSQEDHKSMKNLTLNEFDEFYMKEALIEASKAYEILEVPVGCVIVKNNEIIARAHNQRNIGGHVFLHAEMIAIDEACQRLNDWRLEECTLYVTLEPCVMCSGAMIQSRLTRLVYGALEPKSGVHQSLMRLFDVEFNHHVNVTSSVLQEESTALLKSFFKEIRKQK